MIVQPINNVKYNHINYINKYNQREKQNNFNEPKNQKYSNGVYGRAQVGLNSKNNPSFGVLEDILGPMLESIGFGTASIAFLVTCGFALDYLTHIPDQKREKEATRLYDLREEKIKNIENSMNLNYASAAKYHDNFLQIAEIQPKNDGHEIGLNAVMGYGVEKYKVALDFIVPVLLKKQTNITRIPSGMLLYGPPGGGKTYMAEKICEHLQHFGVNVITVEFKERGHARNAERIKKAFANGKEYYKNTGKPSVIYFPQDIDNYLIDRAKAPEYIKEVRAMINSAENCCDEGVTWIGTANYSQNIDPAILRPGRTDIKLAIGEMENFAIADMIKYVLFKIDEKDSAEEFDYQKVLDKIEAENLVFTPAEIELFVTDAKKHNPTPENFVTADLVIDEIDNYKLKNMTTLTPEVMSKFKEDQEYIRNLDQKVLEKAKEDIKKAEEKKEIMEEKAKRADKALSDANYDLEQAERLKDQAIRSKNIIDYTVTKQNETP